MAGLSGIVKKISDLVTGTPADDDCFIFGKTDLKKITLAKLKDALGITSINSALKNKIIIGSYQNAMMIITNQTPDFNNGTATLNMESVASSYEKTILNAFVQLKNASSATITSAIISDNMLTIKCSNLSGTPYDGTIPCTVLLLLV